MAPMTAYDDSGEGPAVIMVHGLGLNRHMWQWQLPALLPEFRTITYDLFGHGDSAKPAGPYDMQRMVGQLAELMSALNIDRAALVGFSLGGLIVRAFALAHPDRTAALVILNSAHARTAAQREAIYVRVRQARESGPSATIDDALQRWFTKGFAEREPETLAQVREWVVANDPAVYPELYALLAEGDEGLENTIACIDCPTLIVTGEDDHGNSPDMARQMTAQMPNSRAEILKGLRHMALAEDPDAVNDLLVPFLRRNLSGLH
ncbi:MAG: alpha/beta fold hydrolase [Gammaproteobacteria bacterium]|nr:alpha/beta fold hydrolase [Gammaproteobacteria bacterium]